MLIIDSRENSKLSKLVMQKAKAIQLPCEKRWIEIGDYVYDDVCFEAKSTTDFLGSVIRSIRKNSIRYGYKTILGSNRRRSSINYYWGKQNKTNYKRCYRTTSI